MIVYFDLFIDLVVLADELFYGVLFQHCENVALGVEVCGV